MFLTQIVGCSDLNTMECIHPDMGTLKGLKNSFDGNAEDAVPTYVAETALKLGLFVVAKTIETGEQVHGVLTFLRGDK